MQVAKGISKSAVTLQCQEVLAASSTSAKTIDDGCKKVVMTF